MTLLFIVSYGRTATFTQCDLLKHSISASRHTGEYLLLKLSAVSITLIPEEFWYFTDSSAVPFLPPVCAARSRHFGTKEKAEIAFKA